MTITFASLMGNTVLHLAFELLCAAVLGGLVGVQRQATHKPAGFRTHVLVGLGACAFMEGSRFAGDPRIAAGVITGIGFLGAGAIVRDGIVTRGLTTAASIWATSAIGLAVGVGTQISITLGGLTAVFVLSVLSLSDRRLDEMFPRHDVTLVNVRFDLTSLTFDEVQALFVGDEVHVKKSEPLSAGIQDGGKTATWTLALRCKHPHAIVATMIAAAKHPGIISVDASGGIEQ